jgi:WhiB family transcriptional regulator, redox-sensing transcriptional regulator
MKPPRQTHEGEIYGPLAPFQFNPQKWQEMALCAGHPDPDMWFRGKGGFPNPGYSREAKQICGACPVRAECLEYALEVKEDFGLWGGATAKERKEIRRERRRKAA